MSSIFRGSPWRKNIRCDGEIAELGQTTAEIGDVFGTPISDATITVGNTALGRHGAIRREAADITSPATRPPASVCWITVFNVTMGCTAVVENRRPARLSGTGVGQGRTGQVGLDAMRHDGHGVLLGLGLRSWSPAHNCIGHFLRSMNENGPRIPLHFRPAAIGSTLLSAILRQNPRFHAGVTSLVASFVLSTLFGQGWRRQRVEQPGKPSPARALMRGLFENYYAWIQDRPVVFDTNRTWTAKPPARPVSGIQVHCLRAQRRGGDGQPERLIRANPYETTRLFANEAERGTVQARVETLAQRTRLVGCLAPLEGRLLC